MYGVPWRGASWGGGGGGVGGVGGGKHEAGGTPPDPQPNSDEQLPISFSILVGKKTCYMLQKITLPNKRNAHLERRLKTH